MFLKSLFSKKAAAVMAAFMMVIPTVMAAPGMAMPAMADETGSDAGQVSPEDAHADSNAAQADSDPAQAGSEAGTEAQTEEGHVDPEKPFIAYLSGVDTRAADLEQSNGDVNVLMVINPQTHNLLLLNTPRDYYIQNPAKGNAMDKLTHCADYGIENSEKALGQLYNCNVDYYMQVNFVGFKEIIDSFGGLNVYSDESFTMTCDDGSTYDVVEGNNFMNGTQALAYARDRYHVAYGDNGRGRHQMYLIQAVLNKIIEDPDSFQNGLEDFLKELGDTFETDIPVLTVFSLVNEQVEQKDQAPKWNVHEYAVTGHNGIDQTASMSQPTDVMYQDPDLVAHASDLVQKVLDGVDLTDDMVGEIVQEW